MLSEITSEVLCDLSAIPDSEDTDPQLNDSRIKLEKQIKFIVLNVVFNAIADADDKPDNGDTYTNLMRCLTLLHSGIALGKTRPPSSPTST